jgi:protein-disulfide isomerase
MGPDTAPVKVFVFSDFQCPVCRRVVEPLKRIARTRPDEVQIVFKHHALETHRHARGAAAAAIAAYRQGKFWEYHDKLFQNQRFLETPDLIRYAEELGLDVLRFQKDMNDPAVAAQVEYEGEMAKQLGARGTPGFFVNGTLLAGWASYPGFEAMVDQARRDAQKFTADGTAKDQVAQLATAAAGEEGKLLADFMWGMKR